MSNSKIDPALLEYVAEGKEIIERVSSYLNQVEHNIEGNDTINSLYRDVHTLKGSSQLFGFKIMAQISHAMEASLDPIRKGKFKLTKRVMSACVRNINLLDKILVEIEQFGVEKVDEGEVISAVSALVDASTSADETNYEIVNDSVSKDEYSNIIQTKSSKEQSSEEVLSQKSLLESNQTNLTNSVISKNAQLSQLVSTESSMQNNSHLPKPESITPVSGASASNNAGGMQIDPTIRVQVHLLDRILNLVGELVLVRNQLVQHRNRIDDADFLNTSKNLDVVTSELQGEVMKTRMQPIETVVGKFHRVVRDIARDLNKKIDLTLEGSDTELDKSLLETIKDPLTHIIRNACDHGIETPSDRKAANKPDTGHILIRSYHEGGQVVIEISDDGRGINRKRVTAKAIEKGLITAEKAGKLSDREVCELIFLPGFSTASEVTSVSGRGVGMDVVKTNIEKVGGTVEIKSVEGKGTSMQLRIPLTLAIVPALLVKSGNLKFAIPQVKLVELVRVDNTSGSMQIEKLQSNPMFRLRGQLLPLFDVRQITKETYDSDYKNGIYIVVLNSEGENFGLLVPEVLDTADIVVKPITNLLNNVSLFSGATILGDGSIALILDIGGLTEYGKLINKSVQKEDREIFNKAEKSVVSSDIQEFLLFSVNAKATHCIPLCLVNRLEEIPLDSVETSGDLNLVKYRDGLLPLIHLNNELKYTGNRFVSEDKVKNRQRLPVVVVQRSGKYFGLVVDEILDVLTIEGQIDDSIRDRAGLLGNLIFQDDVIVVVDALGIVESFSNKISGNRSGLGKTYSDKLTELREINKEMKFKSIRVLYAEDVAFFRKHVSKVLHGAGIDVTTFEDGAKALRELNNSEPDRYNLILSDIEMPNLNGYQLAREIRKLPQYKNIPLIALTTRFREKDIEEGVNAGFNRYLEKLNPEKLMQAINELMNKEVDNSSNSGNEVRN